MKTLKTLITGGSGLVGKQLSHLLKSNNHEVYHLSRKSGNTGYKTFKWSIKDGYIDPEALQVDHIIHLAGAGVADKRWSTKRKEIIRSSRIDSTRLIAEKIKMCNPGIKSFICASAIGIYGLNTGEKWVDEQSKPASDFLATLVTDWEREIEKLKALTIPVGILRIGVVLAGEGGALPKLIQPISIGAGAALGCGKQYLSWIHINDLCRIFLWMLEENQYQTFNAVAPHPVTNKEITIEIANVIKKKIILPNVPAFVLKGLLGEMANIVLGGNRVSCENIQKLGFEFKYPELRPALKNLLTAQQ